MRLTSLRLTRYGPFDDLQLTLDPSRLTLICAPNGAGKSVLRTAFADLLFGIGGKSPMGFRFNYAGMHLAATALDTANQPIAFGRRKGHGNTLTDASGTPTDALSLATYLGATDRDALERLFALDTDRLRRGGDDLMASGGLVAEALLSAGGLSNARAARRALEDQADRLAPTRKSAAKPFYVAADRFVSARKAAGEALLKPDAWEKSRKEIAAADTALAEAKHRAGAAQAATTRLQRLRRVRPIMAEIDASAAWLRENPDAPTLPPSLAPRLEAAAASAAAAAEKLRAETARRAALEAELTAIPADPALLDAAPAIERLAEHAGAIGKALDDIPQRDAALAQIKAQIAHKLRRLGASETADPAALIPPRALETRTRALIRDHGNHHGACRDARRTLDALEAKIAARRAAMVPEPDPEDVDALATLTNEIRAQGDPAALAQEAAARATAAGAALQTALAETPFWTGDATALKALPVPAAQALDRAHAALTQAEAAHRHEAGATAQAQHRLAEAEARLRDIVGDTVVPDMAAVAAARQRRQHLWDLVARQAFAGEPPGPEAAPLLAGQPLALAYERAVTEADRLADRRADESTLIERSREAERQIALAADALQTAQTRLATAAHAAETAAQAWRDLLPAGLPPASRLDDVRAFLAARTRVIERLEAATLARQAETALAARHQAWAARLRAALDMPADDLPHLLAAALRQVTHAALAEKRRAEYEAALVELDQQHKAAAATCHDAETARAVWQAEWTRALAELGRPAGEAPSITDDILGLLAELDADLTEAARLHTRIADMRTDNARFTADCAALLATAAPAAPPPATTEAALAQLRTLRDAAALARKRDTERATLRAQLDQADRNGAALAATHAQRQADLAAILAAIGAGTLEAAELRLAQAAIRARHAETLQAAEDRLHRESDGIDAATLRAELATLSAEDVAAALSTAEAEAGAAQAALEHHAAHAATLRQSLAQREAETSYADAIADQTEAAATAGRVLREALVARLAATLLAHAMETVEAQSSPAMLGRIGHWFARLTNGAYPAIGLEQTEDGLALILTQAGFPHEPKRVGQLSEGTRDQLYLALRLAAIEENRTPLPFIADDILQTADDARATAALEALVELSARTQVILLTHHRHIVDLAGALPAGSVHVARLESEAVA